MDSLTPEERKIIDDYNKEYGRTDGLFHLDDFLDQLAKSTTVKFTRWCEDEMKRLGIKHSVVVKDDK